MDNNAFLDRLRYRAKKTGTFIEDAGREATRKYHILHGTRLALIAASAVMGAALDLLTAYRRGALALGYRRLITYTLTSEPGDSLRAAGWQDLAQVRGWSWNCPSSPRRPRESLDKRRWEAPPSISYQQRPQPP